MRTLISLASVFALVTTLAGGCERSIPEPMRRAARVADTTPEILVVDDIESATGLRGYEELTVRPTLRAAVRPPPALVRKRPGHVRTETTRITPEPKPPDDSRAEAEAQPTPERAPAEIRVPSRPPQATEQPSWYTPRRGEPPSTAVSVSVAIGSVATIMGSTAAMGDGTSGERAFALTCLGIGIVSFGTALLLHATEPAPKAGVSVSLTPIGIGGTF